MISDLSAKNMYPETVMRLCISIGVSFEIWHSQNFRNMRLFGKSYLVWNVRYVVSKHFT